ncbi:hypothetical protein [Capnocytophaga stomatis]|uniref:Uncharacterized protein n=1 Tax=Capnocytophaga stomatis TaxID=1848904 RepID=A0ABW8QDH2_9FLAO|nr:hypothetical protein [Capnocytophaga stomatis]GIJ95328.1 hypothetical protein CAPN002_25460 [Capnocytophaga stomatis]
MCHETVRLLLSLVILCGSLASISKVINESPVSSNAWVGAAYLYATQTDSSPEVGAIFGVVGTVESSVLGYGAALAWGGPVGLAVGLGVGL